MATPGRRSLRFEHLEEILTEVDRLRLGHTTLGRWTLSQICQHLAETMRLALSMPATIEHDPSLRLSQETIERVFQTGELGEGLALPSVLKIPEPMDEGRAAMILGEAITEYAKSAGPVGPHRYLGPLSKARWDHLQRIHCAHHLSFVIPKV